MYRFNKFILNITVEAPEGDGYNPATTGYGLRSTLQIFDKTEPVQFLTASNVITDLNILQQLPPQSVLFTHDSVFANPQEAVRMTWEKGVVWLYGAYTDLKHPYIASPAGNFPPLLEYALIYADRILVPSESFKEYILRNYGKYVKNAEDYITKIRLYRPKEVFHKKQVDREKLFIKYGIDYKEGQKIILNVGRAEVLQKNTFLFDKVAERFWEEGRDEYVFIKIGGGQQPITKHKNLIHIGKLPQQELTYFYSIAHIYFSPSLTESFGLALLEYVMCGGERVILTKDTGIYTENKEHFDENCVIDPTNVKYEEVREKILNIEKYKIKDAQKIIEKYSDKKGILDELNELFSLGKTNPGDRFWQRHFIIHKNTKVDEVFLENYRVDSDGGFDVVMGADEVEEWKVRLEEVVRELRDEVRVVWQVADERGLGEFATLTSRITPIYKITTTQITPIPETQNSMIIKTVMKLRKEVRSLVAPSS